MDDFTECGHKDICPRHERDRIAEEDAAILKADIDQDSEQADEIRRRVQAHGNWHYTETPCGP